MIHPTKMPTGRNMYTTSKPALLEVCVTSLQQSNNFSRHWKVTIHGLMFSSRTVIFKSGSSVFTLMKYILYILLVLCAMGFWLSDLLGENSMNSKPYFCHRSHGKHCWPLFHCTFSRPLRPRSFDPIMPPFRSLQTGQTQSMPLIKSLQALRHLRTMTVFS
ncbi:hypothetical protein L208DRAFT_1507763 [Tricholoma matsutake]|nr:hypothetical protein L208DRAFT_1507763 [Tricholoma matsutake 945]